MRPQILYNQDKRATLLKVVDWSNVALFRANLATMIKGVTAHHARVQIAITTRMSDLAQKWVRLGPNVTYLCLFF